MRSWEDELEEEVLTPTSLMGGGGGSLAHVLQYAGRDVEEEEEKEFASYLQRKVERYRQQDKKAKRPIDPNKYITKEWLNKCLGKGCRNC